MYYNQSINSLANLLNKLGQKFYKGKKQTFYIILKIYLVLYVIEKE